MNESDSSNKASLKATGVPLLDLKAQYRSIRDEVREAIDKVLESQYFILGPEVVALEEEIAEYCQCSHAVGVSSGTDALLIALMAIDIRPGDEVITTPYTFFATAGAIHRLGAKPVFVDIDPVSYNIDPNLIEAAITDKTRAVIPVHLYGQCAEMDAVLEIAAGRNLAVIEDAAQAIGSEYKGRRAGSFGAVGCFSFFPSKNLGGVGDGGIATCNDPELAEKMKILRTHGSKPKYYHKIVGGNFRLDAINAAALRVKLKHLDDWTALRQQNASDYDRHFEEAGLAGDKIKLPEVGQSRHIFNQYVIRTERRDELRKFMQDNRIGSEVYYPVPLHLQECFADMGYKPGDLEHSEAAAEETLALPIYPELTMEQKEFVVETIGNFFMG